MNQYFVLWRSRGLIWIPDRRLVDMGLELRISNDAMSGSARHQGGDWNARASSMRVYIRYGEESLGYQSCTRADVDLT